jgi:hypothetical protein
MNSKYEILDDDDVNKFISSTRKGIREVLHNKEPERLLPYLVTRNSSRGDFPWKR